MAITTHDLHLLRHRFVQDSGVPIQVLHSPYFSSRLELFEKEYGALSKYKEYFSYVTEHYGENIQKFLEDYHSLRDRIINEVTNNKAYKDFLEDKTITEEIKSYKPVIGEAKLYTQEQVKEGNNMFLSLDMKKANFQTLKYINPAIVYDCDTYDDFIRRFTDIEIAIKSKRTREIIFGKLNPNRTMKYEKIIMSIIEKWLIANTNIYSYFDLFSINSDEIIYKLKPQYNFDAVIKSVSEKLNEDIIKLNIGIDVRIEFFKLICHNFKTHASDKIMNVFVKEFSDDRKAYKCANEIYFPQTYKLINGLTIDENDLVFYFDKMELAKFFHPLEKI